MGSIIILTAVISAFLVEIYTWKAGVVPMPTIPRVRREMIKLSPHEMDGEIWELGSGWGGLLMALAKRYPNNRIVGFEISPLPYFICLLRIWLGRYQNIRLKRQNFMLMDFSCVGSLYCYLTHTHMRQLQPKLTKEMQMGSVLITSTFPLPDLKPNEEVISKGFWVVKIFKYVF